MTLFLNNFGKNKNIQIQKRTIGQVTLSAYIFMRIVKIARTFSMARPSICYDTSVTKSHNGSQLLFPGWSHVNAPMVKPFRLPYLAQGGGRGREEGMVDTLLLEILTIASLTFCLLLTDRPILGLPGYKLKLSIFVKWMGQGVLKLWCHELFDH